MPAVRISIKLALVGNDFRSQRIQMNVADKVPEDMDLAGIRWIYSGFEKDVRNGDVDG